MFTDIVGYTALTQASESRALEILEKHNEMLRPLFSKYRGKEIKTIGDSFLVEFPSALEATQCAAEIQKLLHDYNTSAEQGRRIEVRIGIHLGDIIGKKNDVFGDAVNIASRIQPLAEPEGICISEQVYDQIHNKIDYPLEEVEHPNLKNVEFSTAVYRVIMPWQRPSPKEETELVQSEAGAQATNNLPRQPPLIGREALIESIWPVVLRNNIRTITLTGPGGVGKTSVAIEAARSLLGSFPNGVYFVPLESISDPNLVLPTIAKAVGVKERPNEPLIETLKDSLRHRQTLVLLDNFEQIATTSAHFVSEMSDSCPGLKFIVTSRKPLRVPGEHEIAVPPLTVPQLKNLPSIGELTENPAIALFLERTRAIKPDFEISNENARDIAEICVKLDGLPLALELAAARIRILPPRMILTRLSNKLGLLSGGPRDLPARQQALRNTIAWSHDLLDTSEKKLFQRLSVFVGGFTLEAAEAVCLVENDLNVMDGIAGLLDNGLLKRFGEAGPTMEQAADEEYRFGFLETIHAFAAECLQKSNEGEVIEKARTNFFLTLAQNAESKLNGPESIAWLSRLEDEHDNLRASLRWCVDRKETEQCMVMAGALGLFWEYHGYLGEGRQWLDAALRIEPLESSMNTAKVMTREGILAVHQADYRAAYGLLCDAYSVSLRIRDRNGLAQSMRGLAFIASRLSDFSKSSFLYEESANLFRESHNELGTATSLKGLGWSLYNLGETARAKSTLKEAIEIFRKLGDKYMLATCLNLLGQAGYRTDDYNTNRSLLLEGQALAEELGDSVTVGISLMSLGELTRLHERDAESISYYKQAIAIFEEVGERAALGTCYHNMGSSLLHEGHLVEATKCFVEGMSILREQQDDREVATCLAGLGGVALAQGSLERAARLLGAAEGILEKGGTRLDPVDLVEFERNVGSARQRLGAEGFKAEEGAGRGLTLEEAVAYGLEK
jgi:predicted ATPase/class 3 adenylate cyclase